MNREEAVRATRRGAIAAVISGTISLFIVLIALATDAGGQFSVWNNALNLIDVVLVFFVAFGIYKKSRYAAVFMFIYFISAKFYLGFETNNFNAVASLFTLIFLYYFGNAIRGSFVFKRIEKEVNPDYKKTAKWFYFTIIPGTVIIIAAMTFVMMTVTGVLPSTRVQAERDISAKDESVLVANNILQAGENMEYFYSFGVASILQGGTFLSQSRVALYLPDDNQQSFQVYSIRYIDITKIELVEAGSSIKDSLYRIEGRNGQWIQIALSTEQKGDRAFIETLRARVSDAKAF